MNPREIFCTEYGEKNFIDSFAQKTKRIKKENKPLLSVKMGNPGGWAMNWRAFGCCGGRGSVETAPKQLGLGIYTPYSGVYLDKVWR